MLRKYLMIFAVLLCTPVRAADTSTADVIIQIKGASFYPYRVELDLSPTRATVGEYTRWTFATDASDLTYYFAPSANTAPSLPLYGVKNDNLFELHATTIVTRHTGRKFSSLTQAGFDGTFLATELVAGLGDDMRLVKIRNLHNNLTPTFEDLGIIEKQVYRDGASQTDQYTYTSSMAFVPGRARQIQPSGRGTACPYGCPEMTDGNIYTVARRNYPGGQPLLLLEIDRNSATPKKVTKIANWLATGHEITYLVGHEGNLYGLGLKSNGLRVYLINTNTGHLTQILDRPGFAHNLRGVVARPEYRLNSDQPATPPQAPWREPREPSPTGWKPRW